MGLETVVAFQNRVSSHHKITLGAKENFVQEHWPVKPMRGQQKMRLVSTEINVKEEGINYRIHRQAVYYYYYVQASQR